MKEQRSRHLSLCDSWSNLNLTPSLSFHLSFSFGVSLLVCDAERTETPSAPTRFSFNLKAVSNLWIPFCACICTHQKSVRLTFLQKTRNCWQKYCHWADQDWDTGSNWSPNKRTQQPLPWKKIDKLSEVATFFKWNSLQYIWSTKEVSLQIHVFHTARGKQWSFLDTTVYLRICYFDECVSQAIVQRITSYFKRKQPFFNEPSTVLSNQLAGYTKSRWKFEDIPAGACWNWWNENVCILGVEAILRSLQVCLLIILCQIHCSLSAHQVFDVIGTGLRDSSLLTVWREMLSASSRHS